MSAPAPGRQRRVLYRGGSVYSPADPFATAVLLEGGVVAFVGSDEAGAAAARLAPTEVVDLDGALVTPAFVDAHVHVTETGLALRGLDLSRARSGEQVLHAVAAAHTAARADPDAPAAVLVLGHGWDDTRWPDPVPTAEQLDRAAPGAEVYLSRVDVHSALVSPTLAARAGIPAMGADQGWAGGGSARVEREAHHAARDATRTLSPTQRRQVQATALRAAAAAGIGSVHENSAPHVGSAKDLRALLDLAHPPDGAGDDLADPAGPTGPAALPGVLVLWGQAVTDAEQAREVLAALAVPDHHAGRVLGLAGDLVVDGSLGSRTAALAHPYTDAPVLTGHVYLHAAAIAAHVLACTRAGVQAGFHVIGDAATAELITGLVAAEAELGTAAIAGARHRVEHVPMLTPTDITVLARLGITASVQPGFDAAWGGPSGMYATRLGEQRSTALHPFAALAAAGVPLALGSDAPVTPFAPWEAVRAAAFPSTPEHATSARAAFLAHTRGGWRAARRDGQGSLVPGAPATLAVWERTDLLVQAPDSAVAGWSTDVRSGTPGLPDLTPGVPAPRCLRTVVDGRTAHDVL